MYEARYRRSARSQHDEMEERETRLERGLAEGTDLGYTQSPGHSWSPRKETSSPGKARARERWWVEGSSMTDRERLLRAEQESSLPEPGYRGRSNY